MLLGGFWHGANWTFIAWGAMHGGALAIHKIWMEAAGGLVKKMDKNIIYNFFAQLLTFLFVCFCWIFFKATNFDVALAMIHQITYNFSLNVWWEFFGNYHNVIYLMLLGYALHIIPDNLPERIIPRLQKAPMVAYIAIFLIFLVVYSQFKSSTPVMPIYLQF
jgi:D-alanyl-lipoteichoic acid acyltransferase DltB (MBOAT superfamily)